MAAETGAAKTAVVAADGAAANNSLGTEPIEPVRDDETFPRTARLLDASGYGKVFKRNKRLANRHWIVLGHRTGSDESRLGLAIAKKRAKRAVDRNRIKRIARESFRQNRALLKGFDAVVMNKDKAVDASRVELRRSLDTLWLELANSK